MKDPFPREEERVTDVNGVEWKGTGGCGILPVMIQRSR